MPTFKIGNPRGVSKGTAVLTWPCNYPDPKTGELAVGADGNLKLRKGMTEDFNWFEGDEFIRPEGFLQKNVDSRIEEGFIVEVDAAPETGVKKEETDG